MKYGFLLILLFLTNQVLATDRDVTKFQGNQELSNGDKLILGSKYVIKVLVIKIGECITKPDISNLIVENENCYILIKNNKINNCEIRDGDSLVITITTFDNTKTYDCIISFKQSTLEINYINTNKIVDDFDIGENILNDAKYLMYGDNLSIKNILKEFYDISKTPFISSDLLGVTDMNDGETLLNVRNNIAKTDVTNFATGMARFLAERAKAELNEGFFDVMRKQMEKLPELQYFFPATYEYLYQMNANLKTLNMTVLRERFKDDVNALPNNIYHTTMNIDAYEGQNLNFLKTFNYFLTTNPNGQWVNLGLNAVLGNSTGLNPKDLFYNFVHGSDALSKIESKLRVDTVSNRDALNLLNTIKLAELISNSLLSPDPNRYWVTNEEIKELFTNKKLFMTYIGLLLAKSDFDAYKITFNGNSLKTLVENTYTDGTAITKDLTHLVNLVKLLYNSYNQVDQAVQSIRNSEKAELVDNSYNLFSVFNKSILEISIQISQNNLIGNKIYINTEVITKYISPTVDLAYNIYAKKYSFAINNFVEILGNAATGDKSDKIAQMLSSSDEEKKSIIFDYYVANYDKFSDKIINNLKYDKELLNSFVKKSGYTRAQLISIAKKYKIIKNDIELKKEYLLTDKMLMDSLVCHLLYSPEVAIEYLQNFFNDKKKRVTITVSELNKYVTLDSISVSSIFTTLLDSKHFRDYLDNTKAYQNFVQKFSKYGTLIGNVANAQNSDEVKAAIQDAVLPVGSSRIKRYANFSIGLNAFVGAFYGQAYYKENGTTKGMQSFGITAPIGVSFAIGTRNFIGKHNALGLNIQLIDLGSLVNFYYTKGDGAQLPAGTKIQLGDILALGATVSYSLFNSPFSIMGGVQYVPNLSRMPEISTNADFRPLTWRWHVGLAVDIPLFMIKTYTR